VRKCQPAYRPTVRITTLRGSEDEPLRGHGGAEVRRGAAASLPRASGRARVADMDSACVGRRIRTRRSTRRAPGPSAGSAYLASPLLARRFWRHARRAISSTRSRRVCLSRATSARFRSTTKATRAASSRGGSHWNRGLLVPARSCGWRWHELRRSSLRPWSPLLNAPKHRIAKSAEALQHLRSRPSSEHRLLR